jgi:hypothetical protein
MKKNKMNITRKVATKLKRQVPMKMKRQVRRTYKVTKDTLELPRT